MNKDIVNILKKNGLLPACALGFLLVAIFLLFFNEGAPIPQIFEKTQQEKRLQSDIENLKRDLQTIQEDNVRKNEAAKQATVKDFFSVTDEDFSPMLENITTYIKQNGLRMKSIQIGDATEDNLIRNGAGAYSANKVDFELVGYYPQFATLLNDFNSYPYFISISKFDIKPYQYDKRILISNLSVTLYSKRR